MKRACLAMVLACAACGGKKLPLPSNVGAGALAPPTPLPGAAILLKKDPSPEGVDAHVLFNVPDGSIGPFLARRGDVVMAAYVGTSSEGTRRLVSVPLTASGDGRGDAKVVAPVATDATMLTIHPTGGAKPGFLTAWTSLTDRGVVLSAVGVTDDGRARGAPNRARPDQRRHRVARLRSDVARRARGLGRAEQGGRREHPGGDAGAGRGRAGAAGAHRAGGQRVAGGGRLRWARARAGGDRSQKKSEITWQRFDADARPIGAAVVVAAGARIAGDVDAVRVGDETCLAWTDASQPDPQPALAVVDATGHVRGPKRAIEGGAGGTLVGLASGGAGPWWRGKSRSAVDARAGASRSRAWI